MNTCLLTERQKEFLRSLRSGLESNDGTVRTEWIIVSDRGEIVDIIGLNSELLSNCWNQVTQADIDDFIDCGYFRQKGEKSYTLRAQAILDGIRDNFGEENESPMQSYSSKSHSIFGDPLQSPQFLSDIFMVMPFAPEFQPIYKDHIHAIAQSLSLKIARGDDFFSRHEIMHEIWSAINNCRLVIADCTGKNANVFYELGIAHTLKKPVIMITQNINDIPFDVRGKRAIVYEYTPPGMKLFEQQLKDAIMKVLSDAG